MSSAEPLSWSVGPQRQTTQLAASGQGVEGVVVTVNLSNGDTFDVFIPRADYTDPDNVRRIIAERVAIHAGVAGLTGEV